MKITFLDSPYYLDGYKKAIEYVCNNMYPEETQNISVRFEQLTQVYSQASLASSRISIAGKYRYKMPTNGFAKNVYATHPTPTGVMSIFILRPELRRFAYFRCYDENGQNEYNIAKRVVLPNTDGTTKRVVMPIINGDSIRTGVLHFANGSELRFDSATIHSDLDSGNEISSDGNTWTWTTSGNDAVELLQPYTSYVTSYTQTTAGSIINTISDRYLGDWSYVRGDYSWQWRG